MGEIIGIISAITGAISFLGDIGSWWESTFQNPWEASFGLVYRDASKLPKSDSELVSYYNNFIRLPDAENFRIKRISSRKTINLTGSLKWFDGSNSPVTIITVVAGDPQVQPFAGNAGDPITDDKVWGYPTWYLLHAGDVKLGLVSLMSYHTEPKNICFIVGDGLANEAVLKALKQMEYLEGEEGTEPITETEIDYKKIILYGAIGLGIFFVFTLLS